MNCSNSFDELLKEASRLYRYVGRRQLVELGSLFDLKPEEMQIVYMYKLIQGYSLPLLSVCGEYLKELDSN